MARSERSAVQARAAAQALDALILQTLIERGMWGTAGEVAVEVSATMRAVTVSLWRHVRAGVVDRVMEQRGEEPAAVFGVVRAGASPVYPAWLAPAPSIRVYGRQAIKTGWRDGE